MSISRAIDLSAMPLETKTAPQQHKTASGMCRAAGPLLLMSLIGMLFPAPAWTAEPFPNRPVRFIVTFPPGGGLDLMSRIVGRTLTDTWGQQVIIDNRIGAGGTIGTALAAKAAPNGYTLLFVSSSHAINPAVYRKLPYDTEKEFVPITLTTLAPHLLVVHPSFPATSLKELIALAKAKPGTIPYVSGGVGSSTHLAGELLKSLAGIDLLHVPTKGTGPAVTEILSGRIPITIATVPSVLNHVKAGKLRALGLTSTPPCSRMPTRSACCAKVWKWSAARRNNSARRSAPKSSAGKKSWQRQAYRWNKTKNNDWHQYCSRYIRVTAFSNPSPAVQDMNLPLRFTRLPLLSLLPARFPGLALA